MAAEMLSDETIRRRDLRIKVDWSDVAKAIAWSAADDLGIDRDDVDASNAVVELKQEERGSPSYRIGEWTAIVKITLPID